MSVRGALRRRILGGGIAALAVAALTLGGVPAFAEDPIEGVGAITGTVTSEVDGQPVEGVVVSAWGEDGSIWATTTTDAAGAYVLEALVPWAYRVEFSDVPAPLVGEYYDGVHRSWEAQWVPVGDGERVSGIDASLERGGSISGTVVSDADGSPVEGISVEASSDDGSSRAQAVTDANGAYALEGLLAGEFSVQFKGAGDLLGEFWDDSAGWREADRVSVTSGQAVTGIDAGLAAGGSISGTVTREDDGTPVAGVQISASGANGGWAYAETDSEGNYTLSGLRPDAYVIDFRAGAGANLMREYWNDTTDWASATPVEVASGAGVGDVDAALAVGGMISGTVVRTSDGSPVFDATVAALDANGEIRAQAQSDADGVYRIDGLAAGSYAVQFQIPSDSALAVEFWENARTQAAGTLVDVVPEQVVTGIDASLETLGHVTGSVTRASDGSPLWSSSVVAEDPESGEFVGSTWVDMDGLFDLAIAPGTYTVRFSAGDGTVLDEYWQDAYSAGDATTVTVVADGVVSGLDAQLDAAAVITGSVSLDSDEDREVMVEAYDGATRVASAFVDLADGSYTLHAPAGTYTLKASAVFHNGSTTTVKPQWFDGAKKQKRSTPVTVTTQEPVSGIDFTLVADTAG